MRRHRALTAILVPAVAATSLVWITRPRTTYTTVVTESRARLRLEVADHPMTRAKGLAHRSHIDADGLLLAWSVPGVRPIWMRNMRLPLDIVWCGPTGEILAIKQGVQPCQQSAECPQHGASLSGAKYVIELPAHSAAGLRLVVGQRLTFHPNVPATSTH